MTRFMPKRSSVPLLAAVLALAGCTKNTGEVRTIGPAEPAQRAATSFVHCVEAQGGECIAPDPKQSSWDAFALLQWLGGGSPTSILQALRRELEHHRDPLAVQDRFVGVETRMQTLGLWREDLEKVVGVLREEAQDGLTDGWLVHMTCFGDPYELWIATAKHDDRQVVVGMLTSLPSWLGGGPLDDERVEGRLANGTLGNTTTLGVIREGTVDTRWVPIPIEEF
jgi:hypothetical protein